MSAVPHEQTARQMLSPGYIAALVLAVLLLAAGAVIFLGGIWLLALGGSFYYAVAGAGVLATGGLLMARSILAVWVYALTYVFTLIWALWEVGLDGWAQVPRLVGPTIVLALVLLCIPVLRSKRAEGRTQ
ncbi:hypothetical protein [Pelagibacterium xiamenense]|uniref:hypothetical protein n=1 Tax=Pelagibacterium xiamenense TaxID=2901140 RepID=UPI001E545261|nr:hypothetical protein [Pelagibacterium xiamenense]MCD7058648.1 hypothetical protein [Pelagibacterium xiamenense]